MGGAGQASPAPKEPPAGRKRHMPRRHDGMRHVPLSHVHPWWSSLGSSPLLPPIADTIRFHLLSALVPSVNPSPLLTLLQPRSARLSSTVDPGNALRKPKSAQNFTLGRVGPRIVTGAIARYRFCLLAWQHAAEARQRSVPPPWGPEPARFTTLTDIQCDRLWPCTPGKGRGEAG